MNVTSKELPPSGSPICYRSAGDLSLLLDYQKTVQTQACTRPNPAFSSVTIFQMLDIRLILLAHQKTLFWVFGAYFERRVEIDAEKKNHTCRGGKNIYSATATYLFSPHP